MVIIILQLAVDNMRCWSVCLNIGVPKPWSVSDCQVLSTFLDGVRDNPPHSKGLDTYIDYFESIKNFPPNLEISDGEECP